jgi:hypothetical protein
MFMGSPVSGNAPGQATLPPSTPSPSTGNVGSSGNANAAGGSQPVVSTQSKSKTNFFDIFLSEKQIKRNQKHAEVMAALKTYSKIEKQLKDVNDRLDKLISVLTTATGGGTKSLLLAAADEAQASLSAYGRLLESLTKSHANSVLPPAEIKAFHESREAAKKKFNALKDLARKTSNYSVDVGTKIKSIVDEKDKLVLLHKKFLAQHKEITIPTAKRQPIQNSQVDGNESGTSTETESDEE